MHAASRMVFSMMVLMAAQGALAQAPRSGGESQKIMQQYQQLAAEKTALQSQLAQMKKDLDTAQSELAAVKKERDAFKLQKSRSEGVSPQVAQLTAAKESAEKNLDQLKQRTNELVVHYRETATTLKEVESNRNDLQAQLKERQGVFDKCVQDNMSLYELNGQILDRYEHVGVFTKTGTADPFTRIARTRIDNLVVEYREKALELRAKKPAS